MAADHGCVLVENWTAATGGAEFTELRWITVKTVIGTTRSDS